MNRSCLAALYAESIVHDIMEKEARTSVRRVGLAGTEFKVSEETITEEMILNLVDRFSDVVEAVLFTRTMEARRTGADWLWCFETPRQSHYMLVQAKRPSEPLSVPWHRWTIDLSAELNTVTGKTQHQTLIDAAKQLRIKPMYCLYLPACPRFGCEELGFDWDMAPHWYWPRIHHCRSGFVHLSKAESWQIGRTQIKFWEPPGITLAALACCEYSGKGTRGPEREPGYWDAANPEVTFEGLVAQLREQNTVAGAIKIRVEEANG